MGSLLTRCAAATAGTVILVVSVSAVVPISSLSAQAVVRGVLYDDATGTPIRGTVMLVDPVSDMPVVHVGADSLGRFELSAARGTYQIAAVRDGYSALLSAPLALLSGERMTLRVPLARDGTPQHRIAVVSHIKPDVSAQRAAADAADDDRLGAFRTRRTVGTGLHYDQTQFEKSGASTLGQFLQNVPGLHVLDPNSTSSMQMTRTASVNMLTPASATQCHMGWFIDGHRMDIPGRMDAITDGLGTMSLDTIEALEIFRGVSEMPPEFAEPDLRCGAIAIWTRHG